MGFLGENLRVIRVARIDPPQCKTHLCGRGSLNVHKHALSTPKCIFKIHVYLLTQWANLFREREREPIPWERESPYKWKGYP